MKKLLLATLFALGLSGAHAATTTVTVQDGAITLVYVNAAGVLQYAPYATIPDGIAPTFVTWCEAYYASTPSAASSPSGCFNAWFDYFLINPTKALMLAATQNAAAASAVSAISAPQINPAQ